MITAIIPEIINAVVAPIVAPGVLNPKTTKRITNPVLKVEKIIEVIL